MKKVCLNPYLPLDEYVPDGEPHVFGDRIYIYGSHGKQDSEVYCMLDYVSYSAPLDDLSDWHYEGVIYRRNQDPHCGEGVYLWAPDVCQGLDGRYYLYYMYETLTGEYNIPESAFATATISQRTEDESYAGTTLPAGTWQFPQVDVSSRSLPNAYFQSNTNLKLICSFASITYIEPALQTAGLHGKVKVWTCGYESEDYLLNNFGTGGDATYQGFRTAPIEDTAFALVQILDKLNGNTYADKDERVSSLIADMEGGKGAVVPH